MSTERTHQSVIQVLSGVSLSVEKRNMELYVSELSSPYTVYFPSLDIAAVQTGASRLVLYAVRGLLPSLENRYALSSGEWEPAAIKFPSAGRDKPWMSAVAWYFHNGLLLFLEKKISSSLNDVPIARYSPSAEIPILPLYVHTNFPLSEKRFKDSRQPPAIYSPSADISPQPLPPEGSSAPVSHGYFHKD